jgi:hypothetical protein
MESLTMLQQIVADRSSVPTPVPSLECTGATTLRDLPHGTVDAWRMAVCKLAGNSKPEWSAIDHLGQARLAVAVLQLASLSS